MADNFKALVLSQADDKIENQVTELSVDDLPEGDVLVRVEYSDVNYKDGMVVNGIGGLVRDYPHVPGIDFAGVVEESSHARFKIGDKVVLTGWRVGEVHWGGYAQKARVNGDWLVALPDGLSTRQAMAVGTAGLTSMLCVKALEDHGITPAAARYSLPVRRAASGRSRWQFWRVLDTASVRRRDAKHCMTI